jgi:hypothetical protein
MQEFAGILTSFAETEIALPTVLWGTSICVARCVIADPAGIRRDFDSGQ